MEVQKKMFDPRKKILAPERPTFKVAHLLRSHGIVSRDTFLAFQKDFEAIVEKMNEDEVDKFWLNVRGLFGFEDYADCVPINSANVAITWAPLVQCLNAMTLDWNRDISIQKRENVFVSIISAARALIAKQLNVDTYDVAVLRGSSEANSVIHGGLDWEGDRNEVVLWWENHPTNDTVAWGTRQLRYPNMKIINVETEIGNVAQIHEKIVGAVIKGKTRLVSFSSISHLTGTRLPAKTICDDIHQKDPAVHVHVDGAQAWGCTHVDLKKMGCDSFCGSAHKWILGPKETGILYMKKDRVPDFWPKDVGYNAYDGKLRPPPPPKELANDASRFEMLGQRNDISIMGLLYAADLMAMVGFHRAEKRVQKLVKALRDRLEKMHWYKSQRFTVETPGHKGQFNGILTIKFETGPYLPSAPDQDVSVALFNVLYNDHKIAISAIKGNRMRFSPNIHNTEDHIKRIAEAIETTLSRFVVPVPQEQSH